ncbi:MAG: hypothetical protein ACO3CU_10200, partial [Candidatus Nanopelagicales bacterium]
MTEVLVGIDVGTTRIKAVAVGVDGAVLGEADAVTPWRHDGACADADADLFQGRSIAIDELLKSELTTAYRGVPSNGSSAGVPTAPALPAALRDCV